MINNLKKVLVFFRRTRNRIYGKIQLAKVAEHCGEIFIGGKGRTNLTKTTHLGKNVNFNGMIIKGYGHVYIGDNFHSGENCRIITSNHNYEGTKIPYDESFITKDVVIENNVWLGDNVIILGGVKIGEGAIIQAGSVVTKDIEKYGIAGGHPAIIFKYRDAKHYEDLKANQLFH